MIPSTTIQLVRDVLALQDRARAEATSLTDASDHASGAEAVGLAALSAECEQVGRVLANYMPRLLKHVGELPEISDEVPASIADLMRENVPFGQARAELWERFLEAQSRLGDQGKSMPPPTAEDAIIYCRLYPHMPWLAKSGAIELI